MSAFSFINECLKKKVHLILFIHDANVNVYIMVEMTKAVDASSAVIYNFSFIYSVLLASTSVLNPALKP